MRFTILLLTICLFFTSNTMAQVDKTIVFNTVTLPVGGCYLIGDVDGGADFAILVNCNVGDNSQIFAGDWPEGAALAGGGTYPLGPIFSGAGGCPATNMVLGPIHPNHTTFPITVESFESDDISCTGPYDGDSSDGIEDDCYGGITNVTLDITDGSHSFTVGSGANQITYNYTVSSAPAAGPGLICGQDFTADPSPAVPGIPTLSEWGLIILALMLMTAGTLYLVQPILSREKK